jgi:hypothetical protein
MARDHARIRLDIWTDDDWRDLTSSAQWLYLFLLSSPSLSFAGVADWRPGRIAANATDLRRDDVEVFAAELIAGQFILVDADTEEVLIRSFVKHDGLMRSPNVAAAFVKAHAAIASPVLRAVVVDQLQRLYDAQADLRGFTRADVRKLLERRATTFEDGLETLRETLPGTLRRALPETPPGALWETLPAESSNPSGNPSANPSPTPNSLLPTPAPHSSSVPPPVPQGAAAARAALEAAKGKTA